MRRLILLVHTSLDGFVADSKGSLDGFESGEQNLEFVNQLTQTADAALFGRKSYELLDAYWPTAGKKPDATRSEIAYSKWYNSVQKIVISRTLPENSSGNTIVIGDEMGMGIAKIKAQAGKDILVFGSPSVAQALFKHELIDSCWLFLNPVLFGNGIALFSKTRPLTRLRLEEVHRFANGELAMHYFLK